jgi:hypothetical protein
MVGIQMPRLRIVNVSALILVERRHVGAESLRRAEHQTGHQGEDARGGSGGDRQQDVGRTNRQLGREPPLADGAPLHDVVGHANDAVGNGRVEE